MHSIRFSLLLPMVPDESVMVQYYSLPSWHLHLKKKVCLLDTTPSPTGSTNQGAVWGWDSGGSKKRVLRKAQMPKLKQFLGLPTHCEAQGISGKLKLFGRWQQRGGLSLAVLQQFVSTSIMCKRSSASSM